MAKQSKRGKTVYKLVPAGLMDGCDKRVTVARGRRGPHHPALRVPQNGTEG